MIARRMDAASALSIPEAVPICSAESSHSFLAPKKASKACTGCSALSNYKTYRISEATCMCSSHHVTELLAM